MKRTLVFCSLFLLASCERKELSKANLIGEWKLYRVEPVSSSQISTLPAKSEKGNVHLLLGPNDSFKSNQPIITSVTPGYHVSLYGGTWKVDSIAKTLILLGNQDYYYQFSIDKFSGNKLEIRNTSQKANSDIISLPESSQFIYFFEKVDKPAN